MEIKKIFVAGAGLIGGGISQVGAQTGYDVVMRDLTDEICPARAIPATNTSAIPITNIAAATQRAAKVVGTHFFRPVPIMRVVKIVAGLLTPPDTTASAERLAKSLRRETIRVDREVAGFLLNRLSLPSTVEAIELVEAGGRAWSRWTRACGWGSGGRWGLPKPRTWRASTWR